ncbi:alpha/beta hydrolase [Vibrio salinus]|uniref:alpha/beta hydrolase n=1 Tax=Vibrio salinus TaxID=2899784 RepID=UPI001E46E1C6|nr:alpha/beta hydrolase [Vibrio salinus]MCE0494766.1 alpha/beta hydrolase [Vibrio salinus]
MSTEPIISMRTWFPDQLVIPLWPEPDAMPEMQQCYQERSSDPERPDRAVLNITRPEIVVFKPEHPNGIGILLLPGGGYQRVAVDREGTDTARVLNKAGFTVFVMTYRMPNEGHYLGPLTPLADAQRAIRLIRYLPAAHYLSHVGVLGFSAGGHVAASLALQYAKNLYPAQDRADSLETRPDFCALMYPVISMDSTIAHVGSKTELLGSLENDEDITLFSLEKQVSVSVAPCFILHASDDESVVAENSIVFWQALREYGIAAEMHLFEKGGHGFGIQGTEGLPVAMWPELLADWLQKCCQECVG